LTGLAQRLEFWVRRQEFAGIGGTKQGHDWFIETYGDVHGSRVDADNQIAQLNNRGKIG
jgi:hypothetical protein